MLQDPAPKKRGRPAKPNPTPETLKRNERRKRQQERAAGTESQT